MMGRVKTRVTKVDTLAGDVAGVCSVGRVESCLTLTYGLYGKFLWGSDGVGVGQQ